MFRTRMGAVLFASLLAVSPVSAATVSNQGGDVYVSSGDGFAPVRSNTELAPGGRVMVRPGGVAVITYAGNCSVRVGSGLWHVQPSAPCANGTQTIDFTGRMNQQGDPEAEPEPQPGPTINPLYVVVGGVVVGGVIALGVILSQSDDKKPASP